jgi:hypothetical protein
VEGRAACPDKFAEIARDRGLAARFDRSGIGANSLKIVALRSLERILRFVCGPEDLSVGQPRRPSAGGGAVNDEAIRKAVRCDDNWAADPEFLLKRGCHLRLSLLKFAVPAQPLQGAMKPVSPTAELAFFRNFSRKKPRSLKNKCAIRRYVTVYRKYYYYTRISQDVPFITLAYLEKTVRSPSTTGLTGDCRLILNGYSQSGAMNAHAGVNSMFSKLWRATIGLIWAMFFGAFGAFSADSYSKVLT